MISGAVGPGEHELDQSSIWLASILGGAPRRLRGDAFRAKLSPDDSLVVYMSNAGSPRGKWSIWLADGDGENPRAFIEAGGRASLGSPNWSPDGKRVVYRRHASTEGGRLATIESRGLDEDTSTVLVREGIVKRGPGHLFAADFLRLDDRLVYAVDEPAPRNRDQNLWEIAIDPRSGKPRGEPRRLTDWVGLKIRNLSVTSDGSQLAFRDHRGQTDVYVGELSDGGRSLDNVRRLTLDDRYDSPSCWTPDGRAVVFESKRYGNMDLFVQGLDQRNAQDLIVGEGEQRHPQPTPDGAFFLYWESEDAGGWNDPRRLLRIPVGGGPTEIVLETQWPAAAHCATTPDGPCLLLETPEEHVVMLSRLDPLAGRGEELWREDVDYRFQPTRPSLSPDGSRFALAWQTIINQKDVITGANTPIQVDAPPGMNFMDQEWSPDESGFYISAQSARGAALLHVDLQGEAHVLYEDQEGLLSSVQSSPDGRHLAFRKATRESNVWMIENF